MWVVERHVRVVVERQTVVVAVVELESVGQTVVHQIVQEVRLVDCCWAEVASYPLGWLADSKV